MENSSRFEQLKDSIQQFLNDQQWFQQLKQKWEELDPQSQLYLKVSGIIASALMILFFCFSFIWSVHKKKVELAEKTELLHTIQSANDELRQLRESSSSATSNAASNEPWATYLSNIAGTSGIGKESLTLSDEKKGTSTDITKESLFDLSLKHVNIRQVVRYAFSLENGARPVKLRNLLIDTKGDPAGYLDATLSVSAFNISSGQPGK